MNQATIRDAKERDIGRVRALLVETWHDTYDEFIGAQKVAEITNAWHSAELLTQQLGLPDSSFLVAEDQGVILGHAFANAQRPPVLTLSRLYVTPTHQRRGIGKCLLDAAIARHLNCNVVRLLVETENAKGIAFYQREGFAPIGHATVEGIEHLRMERGGKRE